LKPKAPGRALFHAIPHLNPILQIKSFGDKSVEDKIKEFAAKTALRVVIFAFSRLVEAGKAALDGAPFGSVVMKVPGTATTSRWPCYCRLPFALRARAALGASSTSSLMQFLPSARSSSVAMAAQARSTAPSAS